MADTRPTVADLTLGGSGHNGYAYQADVYCIDCGEAIIHRLADEGRLPASWDDAGNTEVCPVPIFFGESPDCAQHCGNCGEYLYGERQEPEEDDITTEDHIRWFQQGRLVLTTADPMDPCSPADDFKEQLQAYMESEGFFPSVWFISDHGNAHRISL